MSCFVIAKKKRRASSLPSLIGKSTYCWGHNPQNTMAFYMCCLSIILQWGEGFPGMLETQTERIASSDVPRGIFFIFKEIDWNPVGEQEGGQVGRRSEGVGLQKAEATVSSCCRVLSRTKVVSSLIFALERPTPLSLNLLWKFHLAPFYCWVYSLIKSPCVFHKSHQQVVDVEARECPCIKQDLSAAWSSTRRRRQDE